MKRICKTGYTKAEHLIRKATYSKDLISRLPLKQEEKFQFIFNF